MGNIYFIGFSKRTNNSNENLLKNNSEYEVVGGEVTIGTQVSTKILNVTNFPNGDSILQEKKTNKW